MKIVATAPPEKTQVSPEATPARPGQPGLIPDEGGSPGPRSPRARDSPAIPSHHGFRVPRSRKRDVETWVQIYRDAAKDLWAAKKGRLTESLDRANAHLAEVSNAVDTTSKRLELMKARRSMLEAEDEMKSAEQIYEGPIGGVETFVTKLGLNSGCQADTDATRHPLEPHRQFPGPGDPATQDRQPSYLREVRPHLRQVGPGSRRDRPPGHRPLATPPREAGAATGWDGVKTFDDTAASKRVAKALEELVSFQFPNETPLEDVLRYMKSATESPGFNGIKYYVDPASLVQVERQLTSVVTIDLEDVPVRLAMKLVLAQFGLTYIVRDGVMIIEVKDLDVIERLDASLRDDVPPPRRPKEAAKARADEPKIGASDVVVS